MKTKDVSPVRAGIILIFTIFLFFAITAPSHAALAPVQWKSADGGNNHWYKVVFTGANISWTDARAAAEASVFSGTSGNLASVTSTEENDFIASLFTRSTWVYNNQNGFFGPWIGGYQPDTSSPNSQGWEWTTGEAWTFDGWEKDNNQPNGGSAQNYAHYYVRLSPSGDPTQEPPTWNDLEVDGPFVWSYVVEYDAVPVPGALLLFGAGLIGLLGLKRK